MTELEKKEGDGEDDVLSIATVEAVLFMHGSPVKYKRLEDLLQCSRKVLQSLVSDLRESYKERSAGLAILEHGDAVQIVTNTDQSIFIERMIKRELDGDLSQASLEVLAIISYRGPLSKPDVEAIRGVNCAYSLRQLSLRGLIEKVDHPTDHRTKIYRTSSKFMRSLGIEDLNALPQYSELAGDKRIDKILHGDYDSQEYDVQIENDESDQK